MFPQNFCPFPTQNFTEWESSHRFVLFFSPFPTCFFIPSSFLSFFFFSQTNNFPSHFYILPPPPSPLLLLSLLHTQPLPLPTITATLAVTDPPIYKLFPLQPPPTATTILFSLSFGVRVSLKCKSLCFSLWVCFDLVFL